MTGIDVLEEALVEAGFELRDVTEKTRGRYRLAINRDGRTARGSYYAGNQHITAWVGLRPDIVLDPDEEHHRALFDALTAALEPGSHMMVNYMDQDTTAEALNVGVPPAATPLGFLLWQAGFRWYKDWYIAEGWKEGGQKLQGNLPPDSETKQVRETEMAEELEEFLDGDARHHRCRELGEQVLTGIRERT